MVIVCSAKPGNRSVVEVTCGPTFRCERPNLLTRVSGPGPYGDRRYAPAIDGMGAGMPGDVGPCDVCVVGSLNVDLVVRVARHPAVGETVIGSTFETFLGGKGFNQARRGGPGRRADGDRRRRRCRQPR